MKKTQRKILQRALVLALISLVVGCAMPGGGALRCAIRGCEKTGSLDYYSTPDVLVQKGAVTLGLASIIDSRPTKTKQIANVRELADGSEGYRWLISEDPRDAVGKLFNTAIDENRLRSANGRPDYLVNIDLKELWRSYPMWSVDAEFDVVAIRSSDGKEMFRKTFHGPTRSTTVDPKGFFTNEFVMKSRPDLPIQKREKFPTDFGDLYFAFFEVSVALSEAIDLALAELSTLPKP